MIAIPEDVYEINRTEETLNFRFAFLLYNKETRQKILTAEGEKNKEKETDVQDERIVGKYFALLQLV